MSDRLTIEQRHNNMAAIKGKDTKPEVMHKLAEMGRHTIVVWECELKPAVREQTLESLAFTLNHIFLQDRSIRHYELPEEDSAMAVEPEPKHRE